MKTKRVILLSVLATLLIVSLLGAYSRSDLSQDKINDGKIAAEQIKSLLLASEDNSQIITLSYKGVTPKGEDPLGGYLLYTDNVNNYYYDSTDQCITAIRQCTKVTEEGSIIDQKDIHSLSDNLVKMCLKNTDFSNVKIDLLPDTNVIKTYQYVEVENNVGTGAMALVSISDKGYIVSATFIQKEDKSSLVSDNQTKTPISESQALDIARTAIIDDIGSGNFESLTLQTGDSEYSAVASTFKGVTFWLIKVNATYLQKGDTMNKFYQIKINYYTGETLEVAKSF
jgi:type II secretory pathway pseudopilin PulG